MLLHVSSTDEDPKHHLCPDGEESWCFFFKKGQAKGKSPKHDKDSMKTVLAPDVAKELEPVYKRLSAPALMEACQRGQTQNTNEGLHSQIWSLCRMTKFMSRARVEAGATIAISRFNMGSSALARTLAHMGLSTGQPFTKQSTSMDKKKVYDAQATKEARTKRMHEELIYMKW